MHFHRLSIFLILFVGFINLCAQPSEGQLRPATPSTSQGITPSPQETAEEQAEQDSTTAQSTTEVEAEQVQPEGSITLPPKSISGAIGGIKVQHIVFCIFVAWVILILLYYIWAVRYHVINLGLSKRMWKILHPEAHARTEFGRKRLLKTRQKLIDRRVEEHALQFGDGGEDYVLPTTPFDVPKENPYKDNSFGLPPGTIRGTLALTALVMFILIQAVNLFDENSLEGHFEGLITAVQMVLAFYFGSKAVDVLKARRERPPVTTAPKPTIPTEKPPKEPIAEIEEPELPSEQPAMVAGLTDARLVNVIEPKAELKPSPQVIKKWHSKATLAERVLALTASFETSQPFPNCFSIVTGNFDGQGLSFGALQWNIGQGTIQPLWKSMYREHEKILKSVLSSRYDEFITMLYQIQREQLEWAKSIQYTEEVQNRRVWRLADEWKTRLRELGKTDEMIQIQVKAAQVRYDIAMANCRHFQLTTERGVSLMFDINVQNGKVNRKGAGDRIFQDYARIPTDLSNEEKQIERMKIISQRRSEVSHPRWRDDVKDRKMTIALGEGTVHGRKYNLEKDFNITLKPYV